MGAADAPPKEEAKKLRKDYKVKIHCIGVGDQIDRGELQDIASKPIDEHLFVVENTHALHEVADVIAKQRTGELFWRYITLFCVALCIHQANRFCGTKAFSWRILSGPVPMGHRQH